MSTTTPASGARHVTVPSVRARKGRTPLVCLTAYSYPIAKLLDPICDVILVGDSLGMVVHGLPTTVGVTLEQMILHGQAVRRGVSEALLVVDLPFGSYEAGPQQAFHTAERVMRETGCSAVKLEGGATMHETVAFLTARGIPVMGHVGLRPQSVNAMGGYKIAGRRKAEWADIEADAHAVAQAGAFSIVLEGVAEPLAAKITASTPVPTIGIGASSMCDGQILVIDDLVGLTQQPPKFAKRYADLDSTITAAANAYADDVRSRQFPSPAHVFSVKD